MFKVILATLTLQMKQSWSRSMFRFTLVASPIINTILIYEMYAKSNPNLYSRYVIFGAGLMGLWSSICFSSVGDINRERYMGTLLYLFSAPTNFNWLLLGKVIGNTLLALTTLGFSIATARVLFGLHLVLYHPWLVLGSLVLIVISFILLSLPIAYLMMLSRKTPLYMNVIEMPMMILSGFVFPIEVLPRPLQALSNLLSTSWGTRLLDAVMMRQVDGATVGKILRMLGLLFIVYLILTLLTWRIVQRQVRQNATLEVN